MAAFTELLSDYQYVTQVNTIGRSGPDGSGNKFSK